MNILLTTSPAPSKSPFFTTEKRPPLGVGFLISILREKKHNVFFIDNYLEPSNFVESNFLQQNNIHLVGVSVNTVCFQESLHLLEKLQNLREKKKWNGKIIVGGPHTSVLIETIPPYVNHIVVGEGEKAILKIVEGTKKRIIKEERIKDLDSLPFQPWDIFGKLNYDYTCEWMSSFPVFTLNTSRGCPFDCSFCSVSAIWGKQYTFFSGERIIEEIKYLVKNYNAKGIYFREDNFTLNKYRVMDFCERLLKENFNIEWACETRVDSLCNEELVKLMSRAGCRAVYLGIESGSQKVLDALNKGITIEQIINAVNLCKKYKINTYCSLLTGTPFETFRDYKKTMRLLKKLKPFKYSFNIFIGIPTSNLYRYLKENNLYEYEDENGLLYPPGFNVKSEFFYNKPSSDFVNYRFIKLTEFDKYLIRELKKRTYYIKTKKFIGKFVPKSVKKLMKKLFQG